MHHSFLGFVPLFVGMNVHRSKERISSLSALYSVTAEITYIYKEYSVIESQVWK